MISIITAVRNQKNVNKIFLHYLKKYTTVPYELIIIDNNSTDGSKELFEEFGAKVIANSDNYSYPYCQNQGLEVAKYDTMAFLNNDIIFSPKWDERLLSVMKKNNIEVATMCTNDRIESAKSSKRLYKKWKYIKYPIQFLFGHSIFGLKLMHKLMYPNWEKFTEKRWEKFGYTTHEGFSGSCVIMKKSAIAKIGPWDDRIQSADFDIFIRTKHRKATVGDIIPMQNLLGVYIHHYGKLTLKSKSYTPFVDKANLIDNDEKWGDKASFYLKDFDKF